MISIDVIEYGDRPIAVLFGIAFYRSTGVNTGTEARGTWFPMLGVTHQKLEGGVVPEALMWPKYSKKQYCNVFEKPTPEAFTHSFDPRHHSTVTKNEIYSRCKTDNMKILPVISETSFKESRTVEEGLNQLKGEELRLWRAHGSDKAQEIINRFLHERLMAISALLGGGLWLTEQGIHTKKMLEEKYPEYFKDTVTLNRVNIHANTDENMWHLNPKDIHNQAQIQSRQVNMWIAFQHGYLNNGDFSAFLKRVEHPELYALTQVTARYKKEIANIKSDFTPNLSLNSDVTASEIEDDEIRENKKLDNRGC